MLSTLEHEHRFFKIVVEMFFYINVIVVLISFLNGFSEAARDEEKGNRTVVFFCDVVHDVKNIPGADDLQSGFVTDVKKELCGLLYATNIHGGWKLLPVC